MAKNIVLCFDGTGNQVDRHSTNVLRLVSCLAEDSPAQIAYYDEGVGTEVGLNSPEHVNAIRGTVDAAVAGSIAQKVMNGYMFILDHYESEDRIFLFGFSRGAYTARTLAGMMKVVGLVRKGMRSVLPRIWRNYSRKGDRYKTFEERHRATSNVKSQFSRDVGTHFLGIWDTVSAVGWQPRVHYPFTVRNPSVRCIRHAVAIDERRAAFPLVHWRASDNQDAKEIWFSGVHSDVGGGYPEKESGLAKISFNWMVEEAITQGLHLDIDKVKLHWACAVVDLCRLIQGRRHMTLVRAFGN